MNPKTYKVKIEKLSLGGSGIARLQDGPVVFVPYSAPGDELEIKIVEEKKNYWLGEISKILSPSPHRIPAPCAVFERCGGCQWQHISYEEQLRQKKQIVEEELSKALKTKITVNKIHASPKELNYRNRIQLHIENGKFGFFSKKSHSLVSIDKCLIVEDSINMKFADLKKAKTGRVEIALDTKENVQIKSTEKEEIEAFSQVNRFQNEILVKTVVDWIININPKKLFEFFAGSGNFTFPILENLPKTEVEAVELNAFSVQQAQERIRSKNLSPKKISFFQGDVEGYIKRRALPDDACVFLDPPRSGCSADFLEQLLASSFKNLVYLSCDPATLGRDLQKIIAANPKWTVKRIEVFDMFPQTYHIETLVELGH